jgi:flagellar biosynthesis protein FlhB
LERNKVGVLNPTLLQFQQEGTEMPLISVFGEERLIIRIQVLTEKHHLLLVVDRKLELLEKMMR